MRERPDDFYGPEDWSGGDPEDDIRRIEESQAKWDAEYAALPLWRRFLFQLFEC